MNESLDRENREDLFRRIIRDISHILCLNFNLGDSTDDELDALFGEPDETDEQPLTEL